jgi:hypothetical protein
VSEAIHLAHQQTRYPGSVHWNPISVAQGDAGQALLASQLARVFPDDNWDPVAENHLARAVGAFRSYPMPPVGAFSGTSGISLCSRAPD